MALKDANDWTREYEKPKYTRTNLFGTVFRREDTVITYSWDTDGNADGIAKQNPEGLNESDWTFDWSGEMDGDRLPYGIYSEIWRIYGEFVKVS